MLAPVAGSGKRLIDHDRRLGASLVAGADEAGRGSLAGPLVAASVLLDLGMLHGPWAAGLSSLDDSKRLAPTTRQVLFGEVLRCAAGVAIEVVSPGEIDRAGVHRANVDALRRALARFAAHADVLLVDGFDLGEAAPPHIAIVDGDASSAAIAAASVVAKEVRDRAMRRLDAVYPEFGFASHVGYITPSHAEAVRRHGPCPLHRRSFNARCYADAPAATVHRA